MTHHQHRILCNRPSNHVKQLGGTTARRKFFSNLVVTSERQRSLLCPARRAYQNPRAFRKLAIEPVCHTRGLFFTASGQRALHVITARNPLLRLCVAPQNQIHSAHLSSRPL